MKRFLLLVPVVCICSSTIHAQWQREDIYSDFVLYPKRTLLEKDLRERVIAKTFSMPLDSNTEYRYANACDAIAQFLFSDSVVIKGLQKMFAYYDTLDSDTRQNFLEAVYAIRPRADQYKMQSVLEKDTDPVHFAICAAYLYRCDTSTGNANFLKIKMVEKFPGYDSMAILPVLLKYLSDESFFDHQKPPDLVDLFRYQRSIGKKIIYSFQRHDRDYPGMAIVQLADGSFVKNADGRLAVFEQLARSGTGMPYFIKNGNTPQGIYSIQGTAISHNHFIGPTPNLQLLLPFENKWEKYFQQDEVEPQDSLQLYKDLLPPSWRNYEPLMEAWDAGKTGRTAIIAHGATIDPDYFKDRHFYPLIPSQGCLTAKELWNNTTGRLLISEQLNLVNAFLSTAGDKGYLYVIDLDNRQEAVSRGEVEALVKKFEQKGNSGNNAP